MQDYLCFVKCKCGCGQTRPSIDKKGRVRQYIIGHQIKTNNPNKGQWIGSSNSCWKGDNAKVQSIHAWLRKHVPKPMLCEECNESPPYDLANISSTYNLETYNRDPKNWKWLCRICHMKSDGRYEKIEQTGLSNKGKKQTDEFRQRVSETMKKIRSERFWSSKKK